MAHCQDFPTNWANQKKRILSLLETMDEQDVADMTGHTLAEIMRAQEGEGQQKKWWGRNSKTGEVIYGKKRGVYRAAQIKGWTEWDWGKVDS